jgi:hypothetical protein
MTTLRFLMGSLLFCASGGCASLESVSVTNIPRERGRPVQASADNPAFLGIHFSNGFADELPDELRRQCPRGKVTGIYSKYESTWYVLVQNRSVTVKGYCVTGDGPRSPFSQSPTPGAAPPPAPAAAPIASAAPPLPAPIPRAAQPAPIARAIPPVSSTNPDAEPVR